MKKIKIETYEWSFEISVFYYTYFNTTNTNILKRYEKKLKYTTTKYLL